MAETTGNGVIETTGEGTAADALARLLDAIESSDKVGLVSQTNHGTNAESVGLELAPMFAVFFGNPNSGTPLMQQSPSAALDLPQKIVIIETDTGVRILHNDPAYVAERHGINPEIPQLAATATVLKNLAATAAGRA